MTASAALEAPVSTAARALGQDAEPGVGAAAVGVPVAGVSSVCTSS